MQLFRKGLIRFADYFVFIGLIMFKALLFERYTGISYKKQGLFEYLAKGFYELLAHGNFGSLQEGIFMVSFGSALLLSFWVFSFPAVPA